MSKLLLVKLNQGGYSLGPEFLISVNIGLSIPSATTYAQLLGPGQIIEVDSGVTQVLLISNGVCVNSQLLELTTTTTTSTIAPTTTTTTTTVAPIPSEGLVIHIDASMVSSYPTTGNTWYDLSGNALDFTLTGTTVFDPIEGNGSIRMSGTSSTNAFCPTNPLFSNYSTGFTSILWLKLGSNLNNRGFIAIDSSIVGSRCFSNATVVSGSSLGVQGLVGRILTSGSTIASTQNPVITGVTTVTSSGATCWLMFSSTFNNSTGFFNNCVNTSFMNSGHVTPNNLLCLSGNTAPFWVGQHFANSNSCPGWYGKMLFYNRPLSDTEISDIYYITNSNYVTCFTGTTTTTTTTVAPTTTTTTTLPITTTTTTTAFSYLHNGEKYDNPQPAWDWFDNACLVSETGYSYYSSSPYIITGNKLFTDSGLTIPVDTTLMGGFRVRSIFQNQNNIKFSVLITNEILAYINCSTGLADENG